MGADALTRTSRGRTVVDQGTLRVSPGEVVAVFGKNGAGKTPLLQMLAGRVGVDDGTIIFRDRDVPRPPADARSRLGLVLIPDGDSVFRKMTVEENLRAIDPGRRAPPSLEKRGLAMSRIVARRIWDGVSGGVSRGVARCSARRRCSCSTNRFPAAALSSGRTVGSDPSAFPMGNERPLQ